jgi:hypothetical protein
MFYSTDPSRVLNVRQNARAYRFQNYTKVKGFIVQTQAEFQIPDRMLSLFFPEIIQW